MADGIVVDIITFTIVDIELQFVFWSFFLNSNRGMLLRDKTHTTTGIIPPTFIYAQAGRTLAQLSSNDSNHEISLLSNGNILIICLFGIAFLSPIFLKRFFR